MRVICIPQDEAVREKIVLLCIYIAVAAMVVTAAMSGWRVNSEIEKAREERVERLEERVERLEGE